MEKRCTFNYSHYKDALRSGLNNKYKFLTCEQYYDYKKENRIRKNICVLRHDIDIKPQNALFFGRIENELGIKSTYFFRVNANEYNMLGYTTFLVIKELIELGHEIGLHIEPMDFETVTGMNPLENVLLNKEIIEKITNRKIRGVACHNDFTNDNNLDFFKTYSLKDINFDYEAYDQNEFNLFNESTYVSDSYSFGWKSYSNGVLRESNMCMCQFFKNEIPNLYILTHPHNWYENHYHTQEISGFMK